MCRAEVWKHNNNNNNKNNRGVTAAVVFTGMEINY